MTDLMRRLYPLLIWSLSALLSASALVLLILMLASVVGPFRFSDPDSRSARSRLAIWTPHAGVGEGMRAAERALRIAAWRGLIPDDRPTLVIHSLSELEGSRAGAVLLPDARSLDGSQLEALSAFLAGGGGVLLTGSIGVRREDGTWLGYRSMARLLRVPGVVPLDREQSEAVWAWRRGPLSAGLAPGQRLALAPEMGVPSISNSQAELRWTDGPDRRDAAASKRIRVGRGRLVWLAFGPENALESEPEEHRALLRVLTSALAWAQGRPALEVLPWPEGAPFAGGVESAPDAPPPHREATVSELARDFERALARSQQTGEVARLRIPTGAFGRSHESELAQRAHRALQDRGAWIADPQQVTEWLRVRSAIATGFTQVGPRRLLVNVTNRASHPALAVALRVHLNRPVGKLALQETTVLQQSPKLRRGDDREALDLLLPELPARASRSYTLDY